MDWELAQTLSDEELEARLYRPALPRSSHQLAPDFAVVHQELKRPGVTLMLLWEEYATGNPLAYKYTSFCIKYREFAQGQQRSMRQIHIAGEKLFVDYAGSTVPSSTRPPARSPRRRSSWPRWARRTTPTPAPPPRQTTADWIGAQVQALEFIGGVPRLIVPDQTRALIKTPDRYDPEPNRTYEEFARHYGCAVLAARPAHPRDKPKVEGSVLLVQRWILARLRNRRFFSLAELNAAIAQLLVELNQRPFKKLPGCRRSAFERLDAPALRPLPASRYAIGRWKGAKVNIDYHVEFEGHYYSVPHRWSAPGSMCASPARCWSASRRTSVWPATRVSAVRGGFTTTAEHMPASHRAHREWTPAKLIAWGQRIGVSTAAVVTWQLQHRPHPEQGYRACLGLLALVRRYSAHGWKRPARGPWRSARPTSEASPTSSSAAWTASLRCSPPTASPVIEHDNVRGPDYYH